MSVYLLRDLPSAAQVQNVLEAWGNYIKLAVGVARGVVAGEGEWQAKCEEPLLEGGSRQNDGWGADKYPGSRTLTFAALINIRPHQRNRSLEIQDTVLRARVERVIRRMIEGP